VQGPASPFRVPRPQKSHAMLSFWEREMGGAEPFGLRRQSGHKNRDRGSRPPKAGTQATLLPASMVAHAHFSEASSLVQVPGRTRSKTGRRPLPFPPRAGFQAEPLRLLANYRPAGKGSTILLKEPQALDDWPLPLGRN